MKVKTFIFNPLQENTYVLYDETKECVIIDCGCLFEREKVTLKEWIAEENLQVKRVLNTHLHLDHAFGNRFLYQEYGVKPEAHQADEFLIPQMAIQADVFNIPMEDEAMPLGNYLKEGDVIQFGNQTLELFHIPGHSPGSLVYFHRKKKILFAGDVLFRGSIGRTDLPKGDHHALINNIQIKLMVLPEETIVYSGHGPTTSIKFEKENNPFLS